MCGAAAYALFSCQVTYLSAFLYTFPSFFLFQDERIGAAQRAFLSGPLADPFSLGLSLWAGQPSLFRYLTLLPRGSLSPDAAVHDPLVSSRATAPFSPLLASFLLFGLRGVFLTRDRADSCLVPFF